MEEKRDKEETKRQMSDQKRCIYSIKTVDTQAYLNSDKNEDEEKIKARKNNQYRDISQRGEEMQCGMQTEWKHSSGGQMPPPRAKGGNEDGSEQDRLVYWLGSRKLMSLN